MRSSFFGTFILLVVVVRKSLRLNSKPVADYTCSLFNSFFFSSFVMKLLESEEA